MKLINMLGSAAFLGIAILCILMTVAEAEAAITLSQDSIASATPTTMDTSSSMAFDHTDQDNKADSMMDDGTKLKKRDYWSTVLLRYDLRCDPAAAETFPHRNHLPPYTPYTMVSRNLIHSILLLMMLTFLATDNHLPAILPSKPLTQRVPTMRAPSRNFPFQPFLQS